MGLLFSQSLHSGGLFIHSTNSCTRPLSPMACRLLRPDSTVAVIAFNFLLACGPSCLLSTPAHVFVPLDVALARLLDA